MTASIKRRLTSILLKFHLHIQNIYMNTFADKNSSSPSHRPCVTPRKSASRTPFTPLRTSHNTPVPVTLSPFTTLRRRKTPASSPSSLYPSSSPVTHQNISKSWPWIGQTVPSSVLEAAVKEIFGYEPRPWQLKIATKVLEGHDSIGIAGTGAGKSLVFAILALASALTGFEGVVIVISPLKSLQKDQVSSGVNHRLMQPRTLTTIDFFPRCEGSTPRGP